MSDPVIDEPIVDTELMMPDQNLVTETDTAMVNDTVSLDDLMNDQTVMLQRENDARSYLSQTLIDITASSLKPKLLEWASLRFPAIFVLITVSLSVPQVCSDGASRLLPQYIEFCSGKTLNEIAASLSQKLPGIQVSFSNAPDALYVHVSRF
jgi:hypothetical protein